MGTVAVGGSEKYLMAQTVVLIPAEPEEGHETVIQMQAKKIYENVE